MSAAEALAFHRARPGYAPTPVHDLPALASELGLASLAVKDESDRFGLPAFKILGASWAIERALRASPGATALIAASAGNHGRAVARVAAERGLTARIFLPARSVTARREAIAAEGAEVVVVDGTYDDAVAAAATAAAGDPAALEIADTGEAPGPPGWVIDGYATLFAEAAAQVPFDLLLVPAGVGALAAAAARHAAHAGARVVAVEPVAAACVTASLRAGRPTRVPTPGTTMAGLDCAEVSAAAWPSLRDGLHGTVCVDDDQAERAIGELARAGLRIGESGAASLAGLRRLVEDPELAELRRATLDGPTRVLLLATEGPTGS